MILARWWLWVETLLTWEQVLHFVVVVVVVVVVVAEQPAQLQCSPPARHRDSNRNETWTTDFRFRFPHEHRCQGCRVSVSCCSRVNCASFLSGSTSEAARTRCSAPRAASPASSLRRTLQKITTTIKMKNFMAPYLITAFFQQLYNMLTVFLALVPLAHQCVVSQRFVPRQKFGRRTDARVGQGQEKRSVF